jgi:biotin/methionine sulfoxide reductase
MHTGANPINRSIPVARVADMLLAPGTQYEFDGKRGTYPDIRLVYWAGGNPFHHHQDLNRLRSAWQKPATIVVHESLWTATARHADIVLPATTTLERNDIGGSSRDRFVLAMHRAIAPVGESRNDFDIFRELASRGGFAAAFTEGMDEMGWIEHIYTRQRQACSERDIALPEFDEFWRQGYAELPRPARDLVLFEAFRADAQRHPLRTPSGRIELYSDAIARFGYADCPPHPAWLPPSEWLGHAQSKRWPLHLITVQPSDRLHAQMDPGPVARANKIAGREKIRMHPDDARARGIEAGDVVRVFNGRGACLAGAAIDDGVLAGVAAMATGAWFDADDDTLERHGNPNVLTPDIGTSQLTQGTSALSVLVEIEKWIGDAPAMMGWEPPRIRREIA